MVGTWDNTTKFSGVDYKSTYTFNTDQTVKVVQNLTHFSSTMKGTYSVNDDIITCTMTSCGDGHRGRRLLTFTELKIYTYTLSGDSLTLAETDGKTRTATGSSSPSMIVLTRAKS